MTSFDEQLPPARTPDAADLADELRLLPIDEKTQKEMNQQRMAEIHGRLLNIAEHLDAHEQALFRQREALRDQLRKVRAEIRKEQRLLQTAIEAREVSNTLFRTPDPSEEKATQRPRMTHERKGRTEYPAELSLRPSPKVKPAVSRPQPENPAPTIATPAEIGEPTSAEPSTAKPSLLAPSSPRAGWAQRLFHRDSARANADERLPEKSQPLASVAGEVDLSFPVRWWTALPVVAATVLVASLVSLGTVDAWRNFASKQSLASQLLSPSSTAEELRSKLQEQAFSLTGPLDADRAYLTAMIERRIDLLQGASGFVKSQPEELPASYESVQAAAALVPTNVWYRLTRAQLAERLKLPTELRTSAWDAVAAYAISEPLYRERIADHYARSGELDWAVTAYSSLLTSYPERAGHVLSQLSDAGMKRKDYLAIVPDDPRAVLAATKFLKSAGHSDWWTYPREPLATFAQQIDSHQLAEVEAIVNLSQLVGKSEETLPILRSAVAKYPHRSDWSLRLAQLSFEANDFEECQRLAQEIVAAAPGSEDAKAARTLIEKVELIGDPRLARAVERQAN